MRRLVYLLLLPVVLYAGAVYSWSGGTHIQTVQNAVNYMKGASSTAEQKWVISLLEYISQQGNTDFTAYVGNKNRDTDNFLDTEMDGWWCPATRTFSIFGLDFANFTSFWHFVTLTRNGTYNNYDGYSYRYSMEDGFWGLNGDTKSYLYNQQCNNYYNAGHGITNPALGATGVKNAYRQRFVYAGSLYNSSTPSGNYEDYQNIIWEPSTNSAVYWYGRALRNRSSNPATSGNVTYVDLGLLGHVLHTAGDINVPQHLWNTLDNNHSGYEGWVDSHRASLYDEGLVSWFIQGFTSLYSDLRAVSLNTMILHFANQSYIETNALWVDPDNIDADTAEKAKYEYNRSVALSVLMMVKFVEDLYVADSQRMF